MTSRPSQALHSVHLLLSAYGRCVLLAFRSEPIMLYSAGIAFNCTLCLIPTLLLLISILGAILNSSALALVRVQQFLHAMIPAAIYTQQIDTAFGMIIERVIRYRTSFGFYGLIMLFWTSTSLLSALKTVLRRIYKITHRESFIAEFLRNNAYIFLLSILFLLSNLLSWMFIGSQPFLREFPLLSGITGTKLNKIAILVLSYLPSVVMFWVLYRFVPGKGVNAGAALVSTVSSALLWWLAGIFFGWHIGHSPMYKTLYGAYAFIIVFLIWIYFSAVVFVVGGVVGQLWRDLAGVGKGENG